MSNIFPGLACPSLPMTDFRRDKRYYDYFHFQRHSSYSKRLLINFLKIFKFIKLKYIKNMIIYLENEGSYCWELVVC